MTVVSLRDVIKRTINGEKVVNGANLSVDDGEIVAVLGAAGSGKRALFDLITGRLKATAGEILIRGVVANEVPPRDRDVAMVHSKDALYPNMTVRANLAFPLRLTKVARQEARERVERVAAELGLTDLLELKPGELSGLDRQLVAIGRALVREPGVLLVDEPSAEAGSAERDQLHSVLGRLRDQGIAAVYATGDPNDAVSLADRVAVMADGAIDQVGPAAALIDHPATLNVATFLSAPGTSFLPGQLDGDVLRSQVGDFLLPAALRAPIGAGQHVVMRIANPQRLGENAPLSLGTAAAADVLASDGLIQPHTLNFLTARADANHAVPLPYSSGDLQLFDTRTGYNLTDPFAWATSGSSAGAGPGDEPGEVSPADRLPERRANAWLQDADLPLVVNKAAKVGFNIGGPRAEAIASAVFSEPDWGEASQLDLLVMLWAGRATVEPAGRELSLPRNGQTEDISFAVTPLAAGKIRLRFRVYLAAQGNLLQELRVDVRVVRQPRMAIA
ncbi:MAG TPA: ABC transporter ATP-binding protein [Trebonia sp.]|jgi:ABC-type sugar transport system ATPase subunit|nr:ABC transporter ATP-binding protein [Trebonia sp.]